MSSITKIKYFTTVLLSILILTFIFYTKISDGSFKRRLKERHVSYPIPYFGNFDRPFVVLKNSWSKKSSSSSAVSNNNNINIPYRNQQIKLKNKFKRDKTFKSRMNLLQKTCQEMKDDQNFEFMTQNVNNMLENLPSVRNSALNVVSFYKPEEYRKVLMNYFNFTLEEISGKSQTGRSDRAIWHPFANRYQAWKTDKKDWIFCLPPEDGSMSWQRSLISAMVKEQTLIPSDIEKTPNLYKILDNLGSIYNVTETKRILFENLFRIINVQHPVVRLYNIWEEKFRRNGKYHLGGRLEQFLKFPEEIDVAIKINDDEDDDADNDSNHHQQHEPNIKKQGSPTHILTWPEFISYWIKENDERKFDHHWHSTIWSCLPCGYEYDFVTKAESIQKDRKCILKMLFPELSNERIDDLSGTEGYDLSVDLDQEKYFLPDGLRVKLREKLYWELRMFDYHY